MIEIKKKTKPSRNKMLLWMSTTKEVQGAECAGVFLWLSTLKLKCVKQQLPAALKGLDWIVRFGPYFCELLRCHDSSECFGSLLAFASVHLCFGLLLQSPIESHLEMSLAVGCLRMQLWVQFPNKFEAMNPWIMDVLVAAWKSVRKQISKKAFVQTKFYSICEQIFPKDDLDKVPSDGRLELCFEGLL